MNFLCPEFENYRALIREIRVIRLNPLSKKNPCNQSNLWSMNFLCPEFENYRALIREIRVIRLNPLSKKNPCNQSNLW